MNTVILDFDGTLADSFDHIVDFLQTQTHRQATELTLDEKQALKGLSMRDVALRIGIPVWRLPFVYFYGRAMLKQRMGSTPVFSGMAEALQALHAEGYRLYIVSSNSRRNIVRFLTEHGLSSYFVRIYGSAGWFGKGYTLRQVLKKQHLVAATTVYVGDESRDIVGAHLAGMPAVAVTWGFGTEEQLLAHKPMLVARTPHELQKALIAWGKEA